MNIRILHLNNAFIAVLHFSHSSVFNNEYNSYPKMSMKWPPVCSWMWNGPTPAVGCEMAPRLQLDVKWPPSLQLDVKWPPSLQLDVKWPHPCSWMWNGPPACSWMWNGPTPAVECKMAPSLQLDVKWPSACSWMWKGPQPAVGCEMAPCLQWDVKWPPACSWMLFLYQSMSLYSALINKSSRLNNRNYFLNIIQTACSHIGIQNILPTSTTFCTFTFISPDFSRESGGR